MGNAISTREPGTLLHRIDQHFNPYALPAGFQDKCVFFIHGAKIDKTFYYDYHLPEASVADVLREHFYHRFDIIAHYGPQLDEERLALYLYKGQEQFDELWRGSLKKRATVQRTTEQRPTIPGMQELMQDLENDYYEVMAEVDREIQERNWRFEGDPTTMLDVFDQRIFSCKDIRAMLILDDFSDWVHQVALKRSATGARTENSKLLRRFRRWCTHSRFLERGHAVFVLSKEMLNADSQNVGISAIARQVTDTDNMQLVELHDHTSEEIRKYLLLREFTHGLPFPHAELDTVAQALANGGRANSSFGLVELRRKLHSPTWPIYIAEMGGQRLDISRVDLDGLREHLRSRLIGQQRAKAWIVNEVRKLVRWGVPKTPAPVLVGLFAGPSGVGKTELCKLVSEYVFGKEAELIRCNEFKESHRVAQLIGSPPSYVGYGEPGILERFLDRDPPGSGVIILDEFEKAHRDFQQFWFTILREGVTETAAGRRLAFGSTFVLATTNAGAEIDQHPEARSWSPEERERQYLDSIGRAFEPALLARLGDVFVFDWFTEEERMRIAQLYVDLRVEELKRMRPKSAHLSIVPTEAFLQELVSRIAPQVGAAVIRRQTERIVDAASELYLDHNLLPPLTLDWSTTHPEVEGIAIRTHFPER